MTNPIKYYEENAHEYAKTTLEIDMSEMHKYVAQFYPEKGNILDIGCGAGRDLKAFKDMGFNMYGLEQSQELCKIAEEYSQCRVFNTNFLRIKEVVEELPFDYFDGLWACGSLVHLDRELLPRMIDLFSSVLGKNKMFYLCFKKGTSETRSKNGLYYNNMLKKDVFNMVKQSENFALTDIWDTINTANNVEWINIILRKRT